MVNRLSREAWFERVAAAERAGCVALQWCLNNGVQPRQVYRWRERFASEGVAPEPGRTFPSANGRGSVNGPTFAHKLAGRGIDAAFGWGAGCKPIGFFSRTQSRGAAKIVTRA